MIKKSDIFKHNPTPIQIDWLQIYCLNDGNDLPLHSGLFRTEKKSYGTTIFTDVYDIFYNNYLYATAAAKPRSSQMNNKMVIVKIQNNNLYESDVFDKKKIMLKELNLQFQAYSRIDICCDFNYLATGDNCEEFIKKFATEKIARLGKTDYHIRGKNENKLIHEYLKFGGKDSDVLVYLYNKSRELRNRVDKPYIRDWWQVHNIDTNIDVMRLEFSLKNGMKNLINTESGLVTSFKDYDFILQENMNILYALLLDKFFHFKKKSSDSNRSRNDDIKVVEINCDKAEYYRLEEKLCSNRSDKIFAKKLEKYNCEIRMHKRPLEPESFKLLEQFIKSRGMEKWANEKLNLNLNVLKKEIDYEQNLMHSKKLFD